MGSGDQCPFIPGKRYLDWELEDPSGRPVDEVRVTRDEIARRAQQLLAEVNASFLASVEIGSYPVRPSVSIADDTAARGSYR